MGVYRVRNTSGGALRHPNTREVVEAGAEDFLRVKKNLMSLWESLGLYKVFEEIGDPPKHAPAPVAKPVRKKAAKKRAARKASPKSSLQDALR